MPNLVRETLKKSGNFIIQNHWSPYRAYSNCFMRAKLHAWGCPFSKYSQVLYIFAQTFKYFANFCPFLPFCWKIAHIYVLSRIGPALGTENVILSLITSELVANLTSLSTFMMGLLKFCRHEQKKGVKIIWQKF